MNPYDDGDRLTEAQLGARIGKSERALRDRRKRGTSSPYVKDGKTIIYSWMKYLQHLERNEQQPVREQRRRERRTESRAT